MADYKRCIEITSMPMLALSSFRLALSDSACKAMFGASFIDTEGLFTFLRLNQHYDELVNELSKHESQLYHEMPILAHCEQTADEEKKGLVLNRFHRKYSSNVTVRNGLDNMQMQALQDFRKNVVIKKTFEEFTLNRFINLHPDMAAEMIEFVIECSNESQPDFNQLACNILLQHDVVYSTYVYI